MVIVELSIPPMKMIFIEVILVILWLSNSYATSKYVKIPNVSDWIY